MNIFELFNDSFEVIRRLDLFVVSLLIVHDEKY
jgi:hypothetical protein